MPSLITRLSGLFNGYRGTPMLPPAAPPVESPEQRAARVVSDVKTQLENTPRRRAPSTDERLPTNYTGGVAGKVWFLPYTDSTTKDTAEIRAAMRLMRRDGYVKAAWEPQILTVASEDWQVQASEAGNQEAEEQADFCKRVIEDYLAGGIISVVRAICAPLGSDGFSIAEKVLGYAEKGRLEKKVVCTHLKAKDADLTGNGVLRLEGDKFGNVVGVQALRGANQKMWPIQDFIYSRHMTVFDEPLGEAVFRPAYGPYWMRDTVRKLRIIHHEKKMAGMLVGTYQADDDKGPLETALARAKSSTWLAIPEGTRVEAVQLSTAGEPDYRSFDESLRDEIVTSIAFATLQVIQGNIPDARGDSKVQKSMADLGPWLLMALTQDAVNTQLFPELIDYNFPYPAGGGYPKLTFGAVSNQELLELLQVVTGAQQLGLKPSRKHYAKALSIQEADPNDPEDELGGQQGMGGFGGGMPPTGGDPYGGGGGGMPPADPYGGDPNALPPDQGGQQFSDDQPYHSFAWEKWTPVDTPAGPRMLSPNKKRMLKVETYNRLKSATRGKTAVPQQPPPAPPVRGGDINNPPLGVAPPAQPRQGPGGLRAGILVPPRPGMPSDSDPVAAGAAVAAGIHKRAAKGIGQATMAAERVAAKVGKYTMLVANNFVGGGAWLAEQLSGIPIVGGGFEMAADKLRRVKVRTRVIANAFGRSYLAGKGKLVREVSRAMGVHWKESRRKYGPVLGAAVEGTMIGWTLGKLAVIGGVGYLAANALTGAAALSTPVAAGVGAAMWAAGKVDDWMEKGLGIGLKPFVRNVAENAARRVSEAWTGERGVRRNDRAPGRVAQAIEWGEGLSDRQLANALRGKRKLLAWYVKGDNRKTGSGRDGGMTRQDAAKWVMAKREIQAADAAGRVPNLPPDDVAVVRRAMEISTSGQVVQAVGSGGMVAGRPADIAAGREAAKERGLFDTTSSGLPTRSRRFSEEGGSGADPTDLVADLRAGLDDVYAAMGLPPSTESDDELAGSLAVTLAMMRQRAGESEQFSDDQPYDQFGWQAARTRGGGVKAVGTAEQQGKTLYGQDARNALARQGGVSARVKTPRNLTYETTDQDGNPTTRREKNVDPEWARQQAVQAALGDPGSPRNLKVTRARVAKKKAEIEAAAAAVEAGDPAAIPVLQQHAVDLVKTAAVDAPAIPPPPPEVKAEFAAAVADSMPDVPRKTASRVGGFLAGLHAVAARGGDWLEARVGQFAAWLGRLPRKILTGVLRGLWSAAKGVGAWALGRGGAAATATWDALKTGGGAAWAKFAKTARPFAIWAAGLGAAAAVLAAPVLAINLGLIPAFKGGMIALAASPLVVFASIKLMRKTGRAAADAGLRSKGYGFLTPDEDAETHAEKFSEKDVALAGPDGARAATLLASAKDEMTGIFRDKCRAAVARLIARPNPLSAPVLFDDAELSDIAGGLSRVIATADILGRARIRRRAEMAEKVARFADVPAPGPKPHDDPFHDFAEPVPALAPERAIEYVRSRVPSVDPGVERYGSRLTRHATTLAVASDEVLLDRIKDAVVKELEGRGDATPDIDRILDAAGVGPRDQQYGEMIARTNAMEAFNRGAQDELAEPDMKEKFPAWEYLGVVDHRTGDDHRPKIGKYYPSSASFAEVRGNRIWNCRCSLAPVHVSQMSGVKVEERW